MHEARNANVPHPQARHYLSLTNTPLINNLIKKTINIII